MENKSRELEKLAGEILSGMAEWRGQHPKATLAEIEREIMKRMAELQERMIEEVAQASKAREWEEEEAPVCPECGVKMEGQGKHKRTLQASGGGEVQLEREYAECPACGAGVFPPG